MSQVHSSEVLQESIATNTRPPVKWRNTLWFLASCLAAFATVFLLRNSGMPREALLMLGIFVLAALLWVTEALPLFATAILVIGLQIVLLANPGKWPGLGFETGTSPTLQEVLAPVSDPVIVLFFGGFLLAQAAIKEGVDKAMAGVILRLFRGRPLMVMLGLMSVTALFSMWMSNTATTAMMITLVIPMLRQIPPEDPIRKALVLSVPFAANIGGMGTPIASPPNAVAVGFLRNAGLEVSFLQWMLIAVPLMLGLLLVTWVLLWKLFRPTTQDLQLEPIEQKIEARGWFVVAVFVLTVCLWLTETMHGLPTAVVALVPAIAFTATGLLGRDDVNGLEWNILLLIMGGIALGAGMQRTGLDRILVEAMPVSGAFILAAMVLATLVFSTFMSNTAAANLLLPIGVSFAAAGNAGSVTAIHLGISIALAASIAMALPISTPPNAIAYARGEVNTRDMALAGGLLGVLGALLITAFGIPIISFWMSR